METAAIVTLATFEILTADMAAFTKAFNVLVRKATKLGIAAPSFKVESTSVVASKIGETGRVERPACGITVVSVSGQAPQLAGWSFVAALEHTDAGNIIRRIPGAADLDERYREIPGLCEHCRLVRSRKDTYVVRHEDGREMQVGRSCLQDFTGHDSPEAIARWAEMLSEFVASKSFDMDSGSGGWGASGIELLPFLAQVVREIEINGWRSRATARDYGGVSTADAAWSALFGDNKDLTAAEQRAFRPAPAHCDRAKEMIEYAADRFDTNAAALSDYEWNLHTIIKNEFVDGRTAGMAASIASWVDRQQGTAALGKRAATLAETSKHVGKPGQRLSFFGATVERVVSFEGTYGYTHLHLFVDAEGNRLTWKSSRAVLETGTPINIKATIKRHTDYKGVAQTELTRCVVLRDEEVTK